MTYFQGEFKELPHIDEHAIVVEAAPELVWTALGEVLFRASPPATRMIGRALGVRPLDLSGDPLALGATLRGFRVGRAEPRAELVLEGEHRFSHYALVFRLDALGVERTRLRAETRAAFPGTAGRAYRTLVIGTRGHVVVVRRLLRATRHRAER